MKLQETHKIYIEQAFSKMKDKVDFLSLLNYCKPLIYGEMTVPFEMRQLNYHCNPKNNKNRYYSFNIRKKSGTLRKIHAPNKGLKAFQKCLNVVLQAVFEPHQAATGFIPGKSVVDNAKIHIGKNYVYNIDLKDFFPSIEKARVYSRLKYPPFRLDNERAKLANIIAGLCCQEMEVERLVEGQWIKKSEFVLPQGAPTSPTITNIICERLDRSLAKVAKKNRLSYSRYADDITFSSYHNRYQKDDEFLKKVQKTITDQNFIIKDEKTRLQRKGYRQEVTGLLVNKDVNVQKRYIKEIRMWLYYWEKYGYDRAYEFFLPRYKAEKGHVKKGKPNLENVLTGKLDYLKMVKGDENELYKKLRFRFEFLRASNNMKEPDKAKVILNETDFSKVKISLEIYNTPEFDGMLNNSINIPKGTKLPNTMIVQNSFTENNDEDVKTDFLFPHNPIYTVSFLKKFKIGDGSGFKELVHDVVLSEEAIQDILNRVKSHPNFISHYHGEKVSDVSFLNKGIVMSVRNLINLFERDGIEYYRKSLKHPYNNDIKYTEFASKFKKNYRYGSGSEYSTLQNDIIDIFNDQRVPSNNLLFLPDERKFNIRASFFTWQPSIYRGIRYIVQGIHDHSNINGDCAYDKEEKKILIEIERVVGELNTFIELRILDSKSVSKNDCSTLLQYLKGSSPFKNDFRNLCDWVVECDFLDESSKRINLLITPGIIKYLQEIEELPHFVGGFKHILKFYDVQ